jgi:hypothetical protein
VLRLKEQHTWSVCNKVLRKALNGDFILVSKFKMFNFIAQAQQVVDIIVAV